MKISVLSESSADESAVKILLDGILGIETELVAYPNELRTGGWPKVRNTLPAIYRAIYYYQPEVEAFAFVIDSDATLVHKRDHEKAGKSEEKCRLCECRSIIERLRQSLSPMPGRKAPISPVSVRLPSGKIRILLPSLTSSPA